MKEYQAVVVKLTRHTREDEDTLTDLLNERSRGGWEPALMSQDEQRLTILFQRDAVAEGYSRTIWATSATRDLCAIMLADSAHIQEKDAEFLAKHKKGFIEPLYGMRHAVRTMDLMVGVPYNRAFDVVPGLRATYIDAGHI